MIVGHVIARREARRQRRSQWMIGICYPYEVKTTDIIIQEPMVMKTIIEPIQEAIIMKPVIEVIKMEPVVMAYSQEKIDEAETMRKLILLQTTLKKFSKKK